MDADLSEILKKPFRVSTDTRTLQAGDVFFALKGPHFDGHDYLEDAAAKGAASLVVERTEGLSAASGKKTRVRVVRDTLEAYGFLAAAYRKKFKIPVIAVTGSCGKTTVKDLIAHVLSRKLKVLKNHGTENNLVGVPKTLLKLDPSFEAAVLELGTNRPGEIAKLASFVQPQAAVITQIGNSHLEGLGSIEGVKTEKLSLARSLAHGGILMVNGEDPNLVGAASDKHRVMKMGFSPELYDVAADEISYHEKGSAFRVGKNLFETPLLGRHNILNCLFAIATARWAGMEDEAIRQALADFCPPPGRLNLREIDGVRFLDDSYNANPTSFAAALDTLDELKVHGRKGVVCGDMLELGKDEEKFHRELGARIAAQYLDFVITAGPRCQALAEGALEAGYDPKRMFTAKDSLGAGEILRKIIRSGDCVLVKGSRGLKMERILECFTTSSIR